MFGLFNKKDPDECPIPLASRDWLEKSFHWLITTFGRDEMIKRKVLTPHVDDFPIKYDGGPGSAEETMIIIARQMEVDPAEIQLEIYQDGTTKVSTGSPWGGVIGLGTHKNISQTAGMYWGKQEDGKYHVWLEKKQLQQADRLVATLSHEIA